VQKKHKNKKVNNLRLEECQQILQKLVGHEQSKYYQDVLHQYRKLIPSFKNAKILSETTTSTDQVTFKSSTLEENK